MAYVRPYQSQQEPSVIPGAPGAPLLDSTARNLSDLGANLGEAQKVVYEADTQRAIMAAHGQLAQGMEDITNYQNQLKTSWHADGTDPTGYTPVIHKFIDDYGTKLIAQQTNPRARAYLADTFARLGMNQVEQASAWERQQVGVYDAGQVDQQSEKWAGVVAGDQTQYAPAKQAIANALSVARLEPNQRQRLQEAANTKLLMAANQAAIENDPHGAYDDFSKRLGLKNTPPQLPPPTPTPGSSAPAVSGPVADQFGPAVDTGVAPGLTGGDAANAQPRGHLKVSPALQAARDRARLGLLQQEFADASRRKDAGDSTAERDMDAVATEINRMGGLPAGGLQTPAPAAPVQVASSGEIATDTGPPAVLPLPPTHTSTGTETGKPWVDELSTQQLVTLRNEAHSRMLQGQSGARAELERQQQAAQAAHKLGLDAPPIPRSLVDAALPDKPTADAKWAEIQAWNHFGEDVQALHRIPDNQITDYVNDTQPKDPSKPGFAARTERWAATAAAAHHIIQTRHDDPVAAMSQEKIGEPTATLDLGDMNKFQAETEKRARNSKVAQGVYFDRPLLWTNPEAKNLATTIAGAPFAVQTQFLATMRRAIPDNATFRGAVQQIYPHAPEIANAAVLATYNPGYPLAPGFAPPQQAAELLLRGEGILAPTKQQAEGDNIKGGKLLMPDEQQLMQKFTAHVGDAYSDHPNALKDDFQAFRAAVAAIASRDGLVIDPTNKAPPDKVVQEALNAAIGGVIQIGEHRAVKPYGMGDDVFLSRYGAAYNAELVRNGLDPKKFPMEDYPPITAADGTYHIRQGVGYLRNAETGEELTVNVPTDTDPLSWGPSLPASQPKIAAALAEPRTAGAGASSRRY